MNRSLPWRGWTLIAICTATAGAIVACGSAAANGAASSPTPSGRGLGRNGTAGTLQQINGQKVILSDPTGADVTVTYTSTTTFTQTRSGTVADITAGTCIVATGQKATGGTITANAVQVRDPVNGSCSFGGGFGGPGGGVRSPNPNATPPSGLANLARVAGQVTPPGVTGTSVSVRETSGTVVSLTIPTTVRVTRSTTVQASSLQQGQCITALGARDSSGGVAARSITIVPPGPNGTCFSGRGGGFGAATGFGGGSAGSADPGAGGPGPAGPVGL